MNFCSCRACSSLKLHRSLLLQAGPTDSESFRGFEDVDLLLGLKWKDWKTNKEPAWVRTDNPPGLEWHICCLYIPSDQVYSCHSMSSSCALIGPGWLHLVWTWSCLFHSKILNETFCKGLTKKDRTRNAVARLYRIWEKTDTWQVWAGVFPKQPHLCLWRVCVKPEKAFIHYVVFSKCGGCLDTSILEITESLLAAFSCMLVFHLPLSRKKIWIWKLSRAGLCSPHRTSIRPSLFPQCHGTQHRDWPTCLVGDEEGDTKHMCHRSPWCCARSLCHAVPK